MTFSEIVASLDAIGRAATEIEFALRDRHVARAIDETVRVEWLVGELRLKLIQQTAESN